MGREAQHKKQQRVVEKQQLTAESTPGGQCLRCVKARMELDLHPSKLGDVRAGVYELLNTMVFQYDEGLQGVVLAFSAPEILSQQVDVQPYFPLCRVPVNVQLTVFCPQKGDLLMGRVTQLGPDFVGLLVLGVINASVAKAQMTNDWVWNAQALEWRSRKNPAHKIDMQSHVRFHVAGLETADAFFGVQGSLLAPGTGSLSFLLGQGEVRGGAASGGSAKQDKKKDRKKDKAAAKTGTKDAGEPELPAMASTTKGKPKDKQQTHKGDGDGDEEGGEAGGEAGGAGRRKKVKKKDREERQDAGPAANGVGAHHPPQGAAAAAAAAEAAAAGGDAAAPGKHKDKKGKKDKSGQQQQHAKEEEEQQQPHQHQGNGAAAAPAASGKKKRKPEQPEQRHAAGAAAEDASASGGGDQKERKKHKKDEGASS